MPLEDKLRRVSVWLGLLACALGAFVLTRWAVPVAGPESSSSMEGSTSPGVAFWLVLAGAALATTPSRRPGLRHAALAGASLALGVAITATTIGAPARSGSLLSGSPHAGVLLVAMSGALLALRQQRDRERRPWSAWLANVVIAIAVAAIVSSLASGESAATRPIQITNLLAVGLLLLSAGTLLAHPEDKHLHLLLARHAAGVLTRRLFIAAVLLPVSFAGILAWLVGYHQFEPAAAVLFFLAATILCGFIVTLFSADTVAGMSEGREEAEQARLLLTARLQQQAAELQDVVDQRTRELREANASLRATAESNALLALVAQNTTSGVVIADAEGRIEWVNGAFTRITGYDREEVCGRPASDFLVGPETDAATSRQFADAIRHGRACHLELCNYTRQGAQFWHALDMQPVRERSGRLINFVANFTDITAERQDRARAIHMSQRLKLATQAAELGIWEWDVATQRTLWDARMAEIYGCKTTTMPARLEEWLAYVHPDDRAGTIARVESETANGSGSFQHAFRIIRATDGSIRQISSSVISERDEQGRLLRVIGTDRDVTAEREVTQQLQSLNERLQFALRSSNYGVWEYDVINRRRHWDERVLEMYGLRSEEFKGNEGSWAKGIHPDDAAETIAYVKQVEQSDATEYDLKFRILRPDGSVRHIESHGHVQRDASGRAIRMVGLSRDITESMLLEQALELAEQRWQLAIEGTNDSVWDWDVTSGHVYHDERWTRILGYEPSELDYTIDGWTKLVHPDDLPANEAAIREHFAQRTTYYCHELRMRAKDGSWRWILDRGKVVRRGPDGRPLRMVGTHSDVTARRELEERLRNTEQLAGEVSRIAQIGGWEINLVTMRVVWNEGVRRICEVDDTYTPTIEKLWQFLPPDAVPSVQGAVHDVSPSAPSFDFEVPLQTARGRRIWVRVLGHAAFSLGRAVSVRGAIQDITARHESESSRRELEAQLFQAQKMETLGTLAGGIAHDFNNLLTGIIGYHELAADSLAPDHPAREWLGEARNASLRARELVEQILTFGRQSGNAEFMPIDLVTVIDEARRFLRATVPTNISIEVHCANNCGNVLGDTTQLHQVILNLGSNAAHAMREHGGTLRISLEPAELTADLALTLGGAQASSYVRLSVSDTGHGMDEATRRRIFDPFFTTKNTREGTGLGLAVVHGIVRSHRGAIDVESAPGKGAAFHIYLPVAATENATETEAVHSAPRGGGEFVCVVDDEEVVGSCTKLVLESQGYQSLIFSSAEQCLGHLQTDPSICSVLITDQTMPGMQGTELAAALRKLRPELPVVIMSGYFSKISPQALDELGQVELLAKPFTTDELANSVYRALHPTTADD